MGRYGNTRPVLQNVQGLEHEPAGRLRLQLKLFHEKGVRDNQGHVNNGSAIVSVNYGKRHDQTIIR